MRFEKNHLKLEVPKNPPPPPSPPVPESSGDCDHKFEARYDEVPNGLYAKVTVPASVPLRDMLYYKVYLKDICVKCGKEIKR